MGKLIHTYQPGPEIMTKPYWDPKAKKFARRFIPTAVRVSFDASDARYVVVDGRRRRRPETLPAARRVQSSQRLAA